MYDSVAFHSISWQPLNWCWYQHERQRHQMAPLFTQICFATSYTANVKDCQQQALTADFKRIMGSDSNGSRTFEMNDIYSCHICDILQLWEMINFEIGGFPLFTCLTVS